MKLLKLSLALILYFLGFVMSKASVMNKPDFAYPQTVSKTANADLDQALSSDSPHAAINALIRLYLAEEMIDPNSFGNSIQTTKSVSEKFKDSDISGLFDALLAKMYYAAYSENRWKYDQRDLPLSPFPDDITEWSGEQYKNVISSLCQESVKKADALSMLSIADYKDIINTSDISAIYYPTLLDFVCANAISLTNSIDSQTFTYYDIAISKAKIRNDIPSIIAWECEEFDGIGIHEESIVDDESEGYDPVSINRDGEKGTIEELTFSLYDKYKDNPYSSLALIYWNNIVFNKWETSISADRIEDYRSKLDQFINAYNCINAFINKHPKAPFINSLKNAIKEYERTYINLSTPSYIAPNTDFNVYSSIINGKNVSFKLYRINYRFINNNRIDYGKRNEVIQSLKGQKPIQEIKFNSKSSNSPISVESCNLALHAPDPGYYVVIPSADMISIDDSNLSLIICLQAYPISVNYGNSSQLEIVRADNGSPIENAEVQFFSYNKNSYISSKTSNKDGLVDCRDITDSYNAYFKIKIGSNTFDYSNVTLSRGWNKQNNTTEQLAQILTDRALYHPGDKVNALAILSESIINDSADINQTLNEFTFKARLYDANYQEIRIIDLITDELGRASFSFDLPKDGLTGNFLISIIDKDGKIIGQKGITVSDYKMPDFEIKVTQILKNFPSDGDVTLSGEAKYYSGMPVANATIETKLYKIPILRFYWVKGNAFLTKDLTTDEHGKFKVTFTQEELKSDKQYGFYSAIFNSTSPTGSFASTEYSFSVGKQYQIYVELKNNKINAQFPYNPKASILDANRDIANIELHWNIKSNDTVVAKGIIGVPSDIADVRPGKYTLNVFTVDPALADTVSTDIVVYNPTSDIMPTVDALWTPNSEITQATNSLEVLIGVLYPNTWVYINILDDRGSMHTIIECWDKGYHTLNIDPSKYPNINQIYVTTVRNAELHQLTFNVTKAPIKSLTINAESFRDKLIPGSHETWKFKILDSNGIPVYSGLALDMYNKALDAIKPHNFSLYRPRLQNTYYCNMNYPYRYGSSSQYSSKIKELNDKELSSFEIPSFELYGYSFMPYNHLYNKGVVLDRSAAMSTMAYCDDAALGNSVEEEVEEAAYDADSGSIASDIYGARAPQEEVEEENFEYRDSDVPMAIWAPYLTTDSLGCVYYTFTVPNANATWALNAIAWDKNMNVANLMKKFVASKPIMVTPNSPRFLRTGDKAKIAVNILNNSDQAAEAMCVIEFFNPSTMEVYDTQKFNVTLDSMGSSVVYGTIDVGMSMSAVGFRVKASNSEYSDGEQSIIPILTSDAALVETIPFYLNPGQERYSMKLPKEKDSKISLTYCENPIWSIVSALPGLMEVNIEYANGAAASIFSAAVAKGILSDNPMIEDVIRQWRDNPNDSALVSMLTKNQDLKIALLNSTPWVQAQQKDSERMANLSLIFDNGNCDEAISKAIESLEKLQRNDGGWAWGDWCQESSEWITGSVLSTLGTLKHLGWLPDDNDLNDMLTRAVKYYDEVVETPKNSDYTPYNNIAYAITRSFFPEIPVSSNGSKVINSAKTYIKKNWKDTSDPSMKAVYALALYLNGDKSNANNIMKSISEFGVWTEDRGLTFPSVNSLTSYSLILDAYSSIMPKSKEVDGLRQQLIIRKQGANWGSSVVTNQVIESILNSGSNWTTTDTDASIEISGKKIFSDNPVETATGCLRINLSEYGGKELNVTTTGVGPSYGAVYVQYNKPMDSVEAFSCDDLSIEKRLMVDRGNGWEYSDGTLQVGEQVRVLLTIHCKRDLSYVEMIDQRPASFQPIDQIPGWVYSDGIGFYRENRDSFTSFHIAYMRPGTYQLDYRMNVGVAGTYSSGVASIQSQYAPEINAHSSGCLISVEIK